MAPELLGSILDNEEVISLGTEVDSSRDARLFFSVADDKFFIAVQDMKTGYVVTILTIEYWHNLSKKHFLEKHTVNKGELLRAVQNRCRWRGLCTGRACRLIARKYEMTRNSKGFLFMSKRQQTTLFMTLDDLVAADHPYRKLDALLSFDELAKP